MIMGYVETIQKVLDYIDEHLKGELSLNELADVANFSPYHFCRVFGWHVGYSVMEYVRIRRLEYIVSEFATRRKLIDIALDYGFETYSGFSKAFKRHYGVAPEKYRIHSQPIKPSPRNLIHMNNYLIGGIIMEPKFIKHDAIRLAGYELKTSNIDGQNNREIPAFWQAYLSDGRGEKLHKSDFVKKHSEYGACFCVDPETGEFSYVIGVEFQEGANVPDEFHTCTIPPATYAVFRTPPASGADFAKSIQGTWQYIMNDWFETSGYEYAPGCVDFEYYDDSNMSSDSYVCEIYIPVVKK